MSKLNSRLCCIECGAEYQVVDGTVFCPHCDDPLRLVKMLAGMVVALMIMSLLIWIAIGAL